MPNKKPEMPTFIKDISALHDLPAETDQVTKRPSDQASHCGPPFVCDPEDMTSESRLAMGSPAPVTKDSLRRALASVPEPQYFRQDFRAVEDRIIAPGMSLSDSLVKFKDPFPKHTKQIEAAGGKVVSSLRMAPELMVYSLRNPTMIRRMVEVMSHLKEGDQSTLPLGVIFALFPFGMSYILVTQEDV